MDTQSKLMDSYLKDLERAAAALPSAQRKELVAQIREHLRGALALPGADRSEAGVRNLIERLGPPEEIVLEAAGELPSHPVRISTVHELVAALFMTIGSLLPVIGWLIGVVLMWGSRRLSTRLKVLGTLVVPGGVGGLMYLGLFSVSTCFTSTSTTSSGQVVTEDSCGDPNVWLTRLETGAAFALLLAALLVPLYLYGVARKQATAEERLRSRAS